MVSGNTRINWPEIPGQKYNGMNTARVVADEATIGQNILLAA